ncbi:Nuclease PA3 [Metarhizium brunneum]|uniref:Nuclease PA3 n=1 Tax=Metarhizium brunneum TaxID=500148 RepID=A0A7D5Z4T6_9HYPO
MSPLVSILLVGLSATKGAYAWGKLGHATVAYIAQHYLSPETASWAQGVLGDTSDSYLANIASWADDYRATAAGKWSAPLHFIDAQDSPPTSCNVDYNRDCGSKGCSVSAVANYTQRVGSKSLSKDNIAQALKFLVHFTGDLTQPLHDEAYQVGGNNIKVTFDGYQDNLHADWDTYIPEKLVGGGALTNAQSWASDLIQQIASGSYQSQAADWIRGDDVGDAIATATRWASEANTFVCSVVMPNGSAALQQGDLYPKYYDAVIDTVELQIAKGGYRLGNWLNNIYKSTVAKRDVGGVGGAEVKPAELPDLMGYDFLPEPRPLSRAQLARAAMEGDCCGKGKGREGHQH